jgi:Lon protease-like protein
MARQMAMFPLGTVLFPGAALPIYLFEPRYLTFYDEVISKGREFGVVLIERGSEVGGGDHRFDVGTAARAVAVDVELDAGEGKLIVAVGAERIRVAQWLVDAPYPKAMVENAASSAPPDAGLVESCVRSLQRAAALLSKGEIDVGASLPELDADPGVAVYQLANLAPLQLIDQQRILQTDDATEQAVLLRELVDAHNELLRLRLSDGRG